MSSWTMQVWNVGLLNLVGGYQQPKCSPMLAGFPTRPYLTNCLNGVGQALAYFLPGPEIGEQYVEFPLTRIVPHFPYGYEVERDSH